MLKTRPTPTRLLLFTLWLQLDIQILEQYNQSSTKLILTATDGTEFECMEVRSTTATFSDTEGKMLSLSKNYLIHNIDHNFLGLKERL
jgi:hypothetical protein